MTPEIKTNWQLYSPDLDIKFPKMKSWVEENESLMHRLRKRETEISLEVLEERICAHTAVSYTHLTLPTILLV